MIKSYFAFRVKSDFTEQRFYIYLFIFNYRRIMYCATYTQSIITTIGKREFVRYHLCVINEYYE